MAKQKKPVTVQQILIKTIEGELEKARIWFTRRNHGLMLDNVWGSPRVEAYDTNVRIGLICGTSGFHGSKNYEWVTFEHGDPASPDANLDASVAGVVSVAKGLFDLKNTKGST